MFKRKHMPSRWPRRSNAFRLSSCVPYVGILIAMLMTGICALSLYQSRRDATTYTRENLRNIALIAQRDIERNFELYESSLQTLAFRLRNPKIMHMPPPTRRQFLLDGLVNSSTLGAILAIDPSGRVILDSDDTSPRTRNLSDQSYFTAQRNHPSLGFFLSPPFHSRTRHGDLSVALSLRIPAPAGKFGGVVVMIIGLDYFRQLLSVLSLGPGGSASLIGKDGLMVMRVPYQTNVIGRNISSASTFKRFMASAEGSFSETASLDGVRRLYWFTQMNRLPWIIMVAAAHDDIYGPWGMRATTVGTLVLSLGMLIVVLSFLLSVQLRRRAQAEAELQLLAETDALTGLSNRRLLDRTLKAESHEAIRARTPISLLFIDLDRFKGYNDTYGHIAGDAALAIVARCIVENLRQPGDNACRYGGEEFVVVLPNTTERHAYDVAERIRTAVENRNLAHALNESGCVTVSIGIVTWRPDRGDDLAALLHAADSAAYCAKARGRNRIVVFNE
ncbi:sensor domain-containing diguanylate cyclase [Burkholderia vietnamiensis]|uniref:sensor domain-containing diguanylate cyclase n=1 Tax=Burkholderia vietnamiensis TaxID=60552 RepID=UPI000B23B62D|nr:sensor domain-containing diguanylate cyclase [Burkholderia vietnamiensis]